MLKLAFAKGIKKHQNTHVSKMKVAVWTFTALCVVAAVLSIMLIAGTHSGWVEDGRMDRPCTSGYGWKGSSMKCLTAPALIVGEHVRGGKTAVALLSVGVAMFATAAIAVLRLKFSGSQVSEQTFIALCVASLVGVMLMFIGPLVIDHDSAYRANYQATAVIIVLVDILAPIIMITACTLIYLSKKSV